MLANRKNMTEKIHMTARNLGYSTVDGSIPFSLKIPLVSTIHSCLNLDAGLYNRLVLEGSECC